MNFVAQWRHDECGLACIMMILRHFHIQKTYREVREMNQCETFYHMGQVIEKVGLNCQMVQTSIENIQNYPVIGLLRYKKRAHFAVIWKCDLLQIIYSDPSKFKIKVVSYQKMKSILSDRFILFDGNTEKREPIKEMYRWYLPYQIKFFCIIFLFLFIIYNLLGFFGII